MATQATSTEKREEHRFVESPGKKSIIVIDLGKRQSRKRVKRLRSGKGRLMERVDGIIDDLIKAGTIDASAPPVVIVVREKMRASVPWPFG